MSTRQRGWEGSNRESPTTFVVVLHDLTSSYPMIHNLFVREANGVFVIRFLNDEVRTMFPSERDKYVAAWILLVISLALLVAYAISWMFGVTPSALVIGTLVGFVWIAARPFLGEQLPTPVQLSRLLASAAFTAATSARAAKSLKDLAEGKVDEDNCDCCKKDKKN